MFLPRWFASSRQPTANSRSACAFPHSLSFITRQEVRQTWDEWDLWDTWVLWVPCLTDRLSERIIRPSFLIALVSFPPRGHRSHSRVCHPALLSRCWRGRGAFAW